MWVLPSNYPLTKSFPSTHERFLPHIIVFNALWWAKEALTWKISTSHYCLQCIMVSKGSPHLKDFYLTLLSSLHYGEQRKPSLERFLPQLLSSIHYSEQSKPSLTSWKENYMLLGKASRRYSLHPPTKIWMLPPSLKNGLISYGNGHLIIRLPEGRRAAQLYKSGKGCWSNIMT